MPPLRKRVGGCEAARAADEEREEDYGETAVGELGAGNSGVERKPNRGNVQ